MSTRNDENQRHIEGIRENIERVYNGYIYKCPVCGEQVYIEDVYELPEHDERLELPCGCEVDSEDELEQVTLWDYFSDALDVTCYVSLGSKELQGVRIMVTCGGPNIYVDTYRRTIELYWWNESATVDLWSDICNEIDSVFKEIYAC